MNESSEAPFYSNIPPFLASACLDGTLDTPIESHRRTPCHVAFTHSVLALICFIYNVVLGSDDPGLMILAFVVWLILNFPGSFLLSFTYLVPVQCLIMQLLLHVNMIYIWTFLFSFI